MSDRFHPISMEQLTAWVFTELEEKDSLFGVPRSAFFVPREDDRFRLEKYGQPLETPFGVAAGPHSQMAQNLIVAWVCGARFLELKTYRFRAHSMYDAELYRSKEEVEERKKDDPIDSYQERAISDGLITQADIDAIEEDAAKEIAEAVEFAEQGDWEPVEDITRHTYARDLS